MTEAIANETFPYFAEERTMLCHTIQRFIADRVLPDSDAWRLRAIERS